VNHIVRIGVKPRNRALGADGHGLGTLPCACARAGSVEPLKFTLPSAQEAVIDVVVVYIEPCDCSGRVPGFELEPERSVQY
jgi:hypothetical protein